jgi:putative phosphoesterase
MWRSTVLKIAVLSDVHSNLEALEAASKNLDANKILVLGDSIGYGANPNEVLDWLQRNKCICIKGNHEEAVISGETGWFNPFAARAILWTRQKITSANMNFIKSLEAKKIVAVGGLKIVMCHGSPNDPLYEYVYKETHEHLFDYYLQKENSNVIAMGHTHLPYLWVGNNGTVLNPGSVGQPRDGDKRASFATMDVEDGVLVEHHRVEYDIPSAAKKILDAGLPEMLAKRLHIGR